jgi:hypothetical protein
MSSYLAGVPGKPIRDMDFWTDAGRWRRTVFT